EGWRYDVALDRWTRMSSQNAPSPRTTQASVWSGSEMIVWGGASCCTIPGTGARYDPVTDLWTPMSTAGAPLDRRSSGGVWTGNRLVVWGGWDGTGAAYFNTGGRYDPA